MSFGEELMQNISIPSLCLNDGADLPQVGIGSFRNLNDSIADTRSFVLEKLSEGIRYFELSELFGNSHIITECCLKEKGIPREELYFSLKIWPKNRKSKDIILACKQILQSADLTYVDLLIMHAPIDIKNRVEQWAGFEVLKNEGLARSIGVANIPIVYLSNLMKKCSIPPAVAEIEVTPFGQRSELVEFCSDNSITIICSDPLAKGIKSNNRALISIAEELQFTTEQIMTKWAFTKGYAVLLSTQSRYLMEFQDGAFDPLPREYMSRLNNLEEGLKTAWETIEIDTVEDAY